MHAGTSDTPNPAATRPSVDVMRGARCSMRGLKPAASACRQRLIVNAGAWRSIKDEGIARQTFQGKRGDAPAAFRQRVRTRQSHDHGLFQQRRNEDVVGGNHRISNECNIHPVLRESLADLVAQALFKRQRYKGERRSERADRLRHRGMKRRGWRNSNGEAALFTPRHAARGLACTIEQAKYRMGIFQQRAARLGQFDAARLAMEQLHVELSLQCLDLLAERRLLHAEPLGGPGDMAAPRRPQRNSANAVIPLPYPKHIDFAS